MKRTQQAPHTRPDAIDGEAETHPNSHGGRRWYQARVNVLGEDHPWWIVPLVILLIV